MSSGIDWSLIKTFLTIYRAGTFVESAAELGVDESTVRRRLSHLERMLGAPIFTRREGRLFLSEDQSGLVEQALRMEKNANQFLDISKSGQRTGAVRISLIDLFAIDLAEDFANFCDDSPEILLDITTEPQIVDLRRDGVDIAIRMARPKQGDEKLRRLGSVGIGLYASREYLERVRGTDRHNLVALGVHYPHSDHQFELADEIKASDHSGIGAATIMVDCYPVMLRLCEVGAGIALLPHFLARKSPLLERFGSSESDIEVDAWALIRPEIANVPKVRKTLDLLIEAFPKRFA
ncbi:LysR family transcriptional regulator [Erythrobacter sp. AP23]|uniref:LysR family transcriptional regulator n=1 Tax=Erythrobacter sp. AP23 TaxID=499656 RepID=UPI00076D7727|nr:LysR family transcriptional regulator [Erythrobacter sp. AP23]KWV94041.1 hypothetical protein ASS64_09280 [Erythrobacter sp. AP23]